MQEDEDGFESSKEVVAIPRLSSWRFHSIVLIECPVVVKNGVKMITEEDGKTG